MVIAAAITALSFTAAVSGTPNSQFPTPNAQQGTVVTQGDASSGVDPAALPISVERIQDALQRPSTLTIPPLPEPSATFRTVVEDTLPFDSVLELMRRDLALWSGANSVIHPPGPLPPSRPVVGVDVLPLISTATRLWKTARARDRVRKELAAFCTVNDCSVLEGGPSTPEGIVPPDLRP